MRGRERDGGGALRYHREVRRPKPTAESRARAERIARSLAGLLDDVPARADAGQGASPDVGQGADDPSPWRTAPPRSGPAGALVCPRCAGEMHTVGTGHGVEIDQCIECGAIWLDAGELDQIVREKEPAEAVSLTMGELRTRMREVLPPGSPVKYRECPRCQQVMRRTNFGTISGVVVDECVQHGVLLDPGELQAIETFVRVGGRELGEQTRLEQGLRSLPPPPDEVYRPGEVRRTLAGTAVDTLFDTLFRW